MDLLLKFVSGLGWNIILFVSMLEPINAVVQNVIIFVLGKSYQDMYDSLKKHGLESWDMSSMFILLYSGTVLSPAYLFCLKDLAPQIAVFVSLYSAKFKKLVVSGNVHISCT